VKTVKETIALLGRTVVVQFGGVNVNCKILDVKTVWGQERWQVEPLSGSGQVWVEANRAKLGQAL
jgi:uncharacterized protein (AIM24 family)